MNCKLKADFEKQTLNTKDVITYNSKIICVQRRGQWKHYLIRIKKIKINMDEIINVINNIRLLKENEKNVKIIKFINSLSVNCLKC